MTNPLSPNPFHGRPVQLAPLNPKNGRDDPPGCAVTVAAGVAEVCTVHPVPASATASERAHRAALGIELRAQQDTGLKRTM